MTHPTQTERFKPVARLFVRDISLSVSDEGGAVDLVDTYDSASLCLSVEDARAVRDWLNEALP